MIEMVGDSGLFQTMVDPMNKVLSIKFSKVFPKKLFVFSEPFIYTKVRKEHCYFSLGGFWRVCNRKKNKNKVKH